MTISSGTVLEWRGLDSQYENENYIRVDSMAASCEVNARIVDASGKPLGLVGISAADLFAALEAGWLVPAADQEQFNKWE